jgi:hypothetical protein
MPEPEVFITFGITPEKKKFIKKYCEPEVRNQTCGAKSSD